MFLSPRSTVLKYPLITLYPAGPLPSGLPYYLSVVNVDLDLVVCSFITQLFGHKRNLNQVDFYHVTAALLGTAVAVISTVVADDILTIMILLMQLLLLVEVLVTPVVGVTDPNCCFCWG